MSRAAFFFSPGNSPWGAHPPIQVLVNPEREIKKIQTIFWGGGGGKRPSAAFKEAEGPTPLPPSRVFDLKKSRGKGSGTGAGSFTVIGTLHGPNPRTCTPMETAQNLPGGCRGGITKTWTTTQLDKPMQIGGGNPLVLLLLFGGPFAWGCRIGRYGRSSP